MNPRDGFPPYTLSRGASSANLSTSPWRKCSVLYSFVFGKQCVYHTAPQRAGLSLYTCLNMRPAGYCFGLGWHFPALLTPYDTPPAPAKDSKNSIHGKPFPVKHFARSGALPFTRPLFAFCKACRLLLQGVCLAAQLLGHACSHVPWHLKPHL